ncbi:MAG: dienelactone hydrolase family protein [Pseudomonadota bacterium]|nr:dienelactone hydrolase family protein [Pseudomonadota bacterium]
MLEFRMSVGRAIGAVLATLAAACSLPAAALSFLPWENTRISYQAFEFGGITRNIAIIAPANPQRNAPAVVVLHFNLGTGPSMSNLTEVGRLARDYGAYVILPEAADQTWAHVPGGTDTTDDVGFLSALITDYVGRYSIDAKRVYMTGYSQGGNMSLRFACEHPEQVAAIAPVAATMRNSLARECTTTVSTPVVFFNGTADKQVPYGPGIPALIRDLTLVGSLGAQDAAKFWAEKNGCTGNAIRTDLPTPINDGTELYVDNYEACPENTGVTAYTIVEGGHTWPGALDFVPVAGITSQNLHANDAMWQFFERFTR